MQRGPTEAKIPPVMVTLIRSFVMSKGKSAGAEDVPRLETVPGQDEVQ